MILPGGQLHLGIMTVVMEIFVFDRNDTIGNRPVVATFVGVKSFFLDKRTDKSEGKKPFKASS